ncbi:hypothetical protein [Coleofasciculus sp. H7-2]|uniref:hypothetical protein n=1 Tax=Coleofasciculus sp. H7-2 TaxID=3351545 RepID=UPI003673483E
MQEFLDLAFPGSNDYKTSKLSPNQYGGLRSENSKDKKTYLFPIEALLGKLKRKGEKNGKK